MIRKNELIGKRLSIVKQVKIAVYSDYATAANVELDQQTTFESAMRIFKREVNNSNIINEVKRRRYHEEAWMARRRKQKKNSYENNSFTNSTSKSDNNDLSKETVD